MCCVFTSRYNTNREFRSVPILPWPLKVVVIVFSTLSIRYTSEAILFFLVYILDFFNFYYFNYLHVIMLLLYFFRKVNYLLVNCHLNQTISYEVYERIIISGWARVEAIL